jgi:fibronectin type 3 domain-containing protein
LNWETSTAIVSGYKPYRSSTSGGPYALLDTVVVTTNYFVDSNVQSGQTYYYVVTSVDSIAGLESAYSNEAKAVIPTP